MRYRLLFLIALLFLVGCSSAAPDTTGQSSGAAAPAPAASLPNQAAAETAPAPTPATTSSPPPSPSAVETAAPLPTSVVATDEGVPVGQIAPAEAETIIAPTARQAIETLKNRDMVRLAGMAHPQKGVVFSPYGWVQPEYVIFKAEELTGALSDPAVRTWGSYDGTGEPIDLTFAAYFDRFVYSQDFAQAPQVGYNRVVGGEYRAEQFDPNSIMIEYHFDGFDPQYGGMDWQSLRLVFEQLDQTWYLVGVIHNQWTI